MGMHFFPATVNFPSGRGSLAKADVVVDIKRPGASDDAQVFAVLTGYDVRFTDAEHHVKQITVKVEVRRQESSRDRARVHVRLGLRDKGRWDDTYHGFVKFGVIVIDDEPDATGRLLSVGLTNSAPGREHASIELDRPSEVPLTFCSFISSFEYVQQDDDDSHVQNVVAMFSKDTDNGAEVVYRDDWQKAKFMAYCQIFDEGSRVAWSSTMDVCVLFLPKDRYAVRPAFWRQYDQRGGRFERHGEVVFEPRFTARAYGLDRCILAFNNGDHPLHRVTGDLHVAEMSRRGDVSVASARFRAGIRDHSNSWDDPYDVYLGGQVVGIDRRMRGQGLIDIEDWRETRELPDWARRRIDRRR